MDDKPIMYEEFIEYLHKEENKYLLMRALEHGTEIKTYTSFVLYSFIAAAIGVSELDVSNFILRFVTFNRLTDFLQKEENEHVLVCVLNRSVDTKSINVLTQKFSYLTNSMLYSLLNEFIEGVERND